MSDATIKVSADTREADRALGRLQNSLGALATGAGIAAFARISDAATELSNRLNQVSKSSTQTSMIFNQLVNVANNARTPLGQTGDLFFRIAKSADQLGISQNQALQTTELVAKAISASGISAAEAAGPLLQLGQALQSGRLQGDELRSIMEGLPPVARALASSLGVPIGALKELGAQGKISGRQVVDAILQARDSIEKDFGKTTMTIGQAITVLSNNFTVLINKFNESSGASSGIVKAINYVSAAINFLGDNAKTIGYIIDILMFIPILRGIKLLAVGLRGVGAYFTNFSYIVRDGAGAVSGFLKYSISQWKSFRTQASGLAQPFVNALDMIIRPLGQFGALLLKISASFLKNFKAPIAAGLMYISGLLDPLINKFKEITGLGGAEVSVDTGGANAKLNSLRARQEQSAKKAMAATTKVQQEQNKDLEKFVKGLRDSNTELNSQLGWLAAKNDLSERDYMIQTELASLNLKASQDGFLTKEVEALNNKIAIAKTDLALQQQIQQAYEEQLKTIRDLGTSVVKGASDPRITAEQKYIDAKIALENYFVTTGEITEATYLQTLKALNEQYTLEKYDIERASMDKTIALNNLKTQSILDNYQREQDALARTTRLQEIAEANRLKNMGFTNDEAQSMAKNYVEFSKKSETEKAQWAIQQGASVLDEMGKTNKAAFQAAKAFNIANAIMNTYAGVTKALAAYPPPFNLIAAGATLAMGLAQVATIRSQQYSGRAIGGTVGKDQSYIVGERGPELFTPTGSGTITPNQNLKSQGDVSVNFTINAVDTRNFQQLLAEQKGLIVGMVRSAVNDRGRSFSA